MTTVAEAQRIIDYLVQERQTLRRVGADVRALEANREALAYWQRELGRAAAHSALSAR
jgi:hypothetical protein